MGASRKPAPVQKLLHLAMCNCNLLDLGSQYSNNPSIFGKRRLSFITYVVEMSSYRYALKIKLSRKMSLLCCLNRDLNSDDDTSAINAARKLTSTLYEPKVKPNGATKDLNHLRVKLASKKSSSLLKNI